MGISETSQEIPSISVHFVVLRSCVTCTVVSLLLKSQFMDIFDIVTFIHQVQRLTG